MKNNLTDIVIILDRSGSMQTVVDDTRGGFDRFVKDQKDAPGEAVLTLVQFDTDYEFVHRAIPIENVPPLDFRPRGNTALLDAIGKAITETGERLEKIPHADRPEKVIFAIITDGQENSSKEFNRQQILEKITHQREKYGWQFTFLGANQDAIQEGASMGIPINSSLTYAQGQRGVHNAFHAMSMNATSFRVGAATTLDYSAKDRKEAIEKDEKDSSSNP